jgi:hypothetical protein
MKVFILALKVSKSSSGILGSYDARSGSYTGLSVPQAESNRNKHKDYSQPTFKLQE